VGKERIIADFPDCDRSPMCHNRSAFSHEAQGISQENGALVPLPA
jgi:hypothetical protein